MKCEILCPCCTDKMHQRQGDGSQYPGEHIKYVSGSAKSNPYTQGGESVCDCCSVPLPVGAQCFAVTIWADHSHSGYSPWEDEFLYIDEIGKAEE